MSNLQARHRRTFYKTRFTRFRLRHRSGSRAGDASQIAVALVHRVREPGPRKASDMFHRKKWPGVAAGVALAVAGPLVLSACGGAQGSSSTLTLGVIAPATTFEAPDMNWGN